jgi:hypothetical protein
MLSSQQIRGVSQENSLAIFSLNGLRQGKELIA